MVGESKPAPAVSEWASAHFGHVGISRAGLMAMAAASARAHAAMPFETVGQLRAVSKELHHVWK